MSTPDRRPKKDLMHTELMRMVRLNIQIIAELPERGRTSWAVIIIVLVKPCPHHTTSRLYATDLHTFTPPSLLAMVDGESRPPN
jgi:hypothetical protein